MAKRQHVTRIETRTFARHPGMTFYGYACSCGARGGEHGNKQGAQFAARYHRGYERERRDRAPMSRPAILEPEPTPALEPAEAPEPGQATLL